MTTKQIKDRYLKHGCIKCPACGSHCIGVLLYGNKANRIQCHACGLKYNEEIKVVGLQFLNEVKILNNKDFLKND